MRTSKFSVSSLKCWRQWAWFQRMVVLVVLVVNVDQLPKSHSFSPPVALIRPTPNALYAQHWRLYARPTLVEEPRTMEEVVTTTTTALERESQRDAPKMNDDTYFHRTGHDDDITRRWHDVSTVVPGMLSTMTMMPFVANANAINLNSFQSGLTVENFQPVCGTSDGVYRVLQQSVSAVVGPDKFVEYGPLIAGGLLRVRLELCVVESFLTEAVVPFIRDNGVAWILPLHETVETFLAGAIFAVATTFILIGSTKLVTVLVTYTDFVLGLPSRLLGGYVFDRAQGKPITLDVGIGPLQTRIMGPPKDQEWPALKVEEISPFAWLILLVSGTVNYFGKTLLFIREVMEAIDSFVGRYLVLWATAYLIIKFLHFKVFPDFP